MKNPDRNTKYYFLDLVEKGSSQGYQLPTLKHFCKVHDEISINSSEFKYCVFHAHEHVEIFYFEKGKGVFETQTEKTEVCANDVIVVSKGTKHRLYSSQEPLEYFNLAITDFCLEAFTSHPFFKKVSLRKKDNRLYAIMRKFEIDAKKSKIRTLRAYSAIYEILDVISQTLTFREEKIQKSTGYLLTEKVKDFIVKNFDKELTMEELSKRFFISKSHLGHSFKREYGVSPIRFMIETRIEQAKVLLLCTDKNITEISSEIGFSNSNYFTFYFTKQVGVSPSEFRNNKSV